MEIKNMESYRLPDILLDAYVDLMDIVEQETDMNKKNCLEDVLIALSASCGTLRTRTDYTISQKFRYGYDVCGEYVIERRVESGICCYHMLKFKRK